MSYTSEDLELIRRAKLALAQGQQVVEVRMASGKSVSYKATQLSELRQVEADIVAALARANQSRRRSRTQKVMTSKGL